MNFQDAVKSGFDKFAVFEGRATRSEYWWWVLFYMVVYISAIAIDIMLGLGVLALLVSLGLMAPSLAVATRRLHDINKSGWWQLLYLLPLIGMIVMVYFLVQPGEQKENRFGPVRI